VTANKTAISVYVLEDVLNAHRHFFDNAHQDARLDAIRRKHPSLFSAMDKHFEMKVRSHVGLTVPPPHSIAGPSSPGRTHLGHDSMRNVTVDGVRALGDYETEQSDCQSASFDNGVQPFPCDLDNAGACAAPVSADCSVAPLWDVRTFPEGGKGVTVADLKDDLDNYACTHFAATLFFNPPEACGSDDATCTADFTKTYSVRSSSGSWLFDFPHWTLAYVFQSAATYAFRDFHCWEVEGKLLSQGACMDFLALKYQGRGFSKTTSLSSSTILLPSEIRFRIGDDPFHEILFSHLSAASPTACKNYCSQFVACIAFVWIKGGLCSLHRATQSTPPSADTYLMDEPPQKKCWVRMPTGCDRTFTDKSIGDPTVPFSDSISASERNCLGTRKLQYNNYCGRTDAVMVWSASPVTPIITEYFAGHLNIDRLFHYCLLHMKSKDVTYPDEIEMRREILKASVALATDIVDTLPIRAGAQEAMWLEARSFLISAVSCYHRVLSEIVEQDPPSYDDDKWKAKELTCRRKTLWSQLQEDDQKFELPTFDNPSMIRANPWRKKYNPMNADVRREFSGGVENPGLTSAISKALDEQKHCVYLGTWRQLDELQASSSELTYADGKVYVSGQHDPALGNKMVTDCAVAASNDRAFKLANDDVLAANHVAAKIYIAINFLADVALAYADLASGCAVDFVGPIFATAAFVLQYAQIIASVAWDEGQLHLDALTFSLNELQTHPTDLAAAAQARADANSRALVQCEVANMATARTLFGCSTNANLCPFGGGNGWSNCDPIARTSKEDKAAAVTCCSASGGGATRYGSDGLCANGGVNAAGSGRVTYDEAEQLCAANGMGLCATQDEIDKACGTGCSVDNAPVWVRPS